jgi:hypothetical protein
MLEIRRKLNLNTADGPFTLLVIEGDDTYWVRVARPSNEGLLAFWSRPIGGTSDADIRELAESIADCMQTSSQSDVRSGHAFRHWESDWEVWLGTPEPIALELHAPSFRADMDDHPFDS